MSRIFESCLKSLPQGCFDCVLNDDCAEMQLYEKGRKDAIDEFVKAFKDNMLKSTKPTWMCYVDEIAEQLKENNI